MSGFVEDYAENASGEISSLFVADFGLLREMR